jgi:hypothetical protein
MESSTSSSEFYNAAEHYGVDHFPDSQSQVAAELSLMLRDLRANDSDVRFRCEDLAGYHFLHFGSDSEIVEEVIESRLARTDDKPWNVEAREHLRNTIIKAEPNWKHTLPVGRIALEHTTKVDPLLDLEFRKSDKFLYTGGIFTSQTAMYLGRSSFDYNTTMYLGRDRLEHDREKIYIDSIKIEGRHIDTLVQAISANAKMLKINRQNIPRSSSDEV